VRRPSALTPVASWRASAFAATLRVFVTTRQAFAATLRVFVTTRQAFAATVLVAMLFAGCSVSNNLAPGNNGGGGDDMPEPDVAPLPDTPLGACSVAPTGQPTVAGMVGPGGGSDRDDIICGANEFPIGFDFRVNTATIATYVRCGALVRDASAVITTTERGRVGDDGDHGTCVMPPGQPVPQQLCPQGQLLVGISLNNITSSYNSFKMMCQPISSAMQLAGATTEVAFTGTGTSTTNVETAMCPAGTAIVSFGLKSGCDQERLVVRCSAIACN
jgi:hypothetical protein